jgi:dolichyl-phosphate beta-glucosyltransferase
VPNLTVIIPAFNEEARIERTLHSLKDDLRRRRIDHEVIVVDDGSKDGTADIVTKSQQTWPELKLLANQVNRGKGYSVRRGALAAKGDVILFSDADQSTPFSEFDKLAERIRLGADMAIGSRRVANARIEEKQSWYRRIMGGTFQFLVRWVVVSGFSDTQCGFKAFTASAAARLFPAQTLDRFAFDVELLFLARSAGMNIAEVPVIWRDAKGGTVSPVVDSTRMLFDIFRIRIRALSFGFRFEKPLRLAPAGSRKRPG